MAIFEGSQNSPMKIQENGDEKGLKTLNSSYFFAFMGFDFFLSSTISTPILPFFFHHLPPEELSLEIILGLAQSFFVI